MKKNTKTKKSTVKTAMSYFPANLLAPVKDFLIDKLRKLQRTKKDMSNEDPFKNLQRMDNNASPDTDAEEQYGHARVAAIRVELNKKAKQIKKALDRIEKGKYGVCEDCGKMIDTDRLAIFPDATLCAADAKKRES